MIMFSTGTGTRRNLAAMREGGWGLLLTPDRPEFRPGFAAVAIDNGAWGAHQRGVPWEPRKWQALCECHGSIAAWTVLPDVVMGGLRSLDLSLSWSEWALARVPKVLIAVQNGLTSCDVAPHLSGRVGIFVGGDTAWKEASMPEWGRLAKAKQCWLHVGRVNSKRRIRLCAMAGADSVDGTSGARFADSIPRLRHAVAQTALELDT
jgi:hypothetical protein